MEKQRVCKTVLLFSDLLCFILPFFFAIILIYSMGYDIEKYIPNEQFLEQALIHFLFSIFGVCWFWLRLRHYTYRKPFWFELKEVLRTIIILSLIELAVIAFSKLYLSRYIWVITWVIILLILPIFRIISKKCLIKAGYYLNNTIIIGGGKNAIDAYYAIKSEKYLGLKVKLFIAPNESDELKSLNVPILKETKQKIWELFTSKTDQFILALEDNESDKLNDWLRYFSRYNYRAVSVIPTLRGLPLYSTNMSFLFSYDVIFLRVNNNLAKISSKILKRTMDISGSLISLSLLFPFLLFLYFLIGISGGHPIYGHKRIGRDGKEFRCWKFRTMVDNSDQILSDLLANDPKMNREWQKDFKLKNDPRITKIGKFLRKYSLDELPQLFNVLIGQMTLVGPRPIVKEELCHYKDNIDYYFMAKPGMTGLWQVSGRNDVDYDMRVYFDSWYVKNWSLWNDIVILCKTFNVIFNKNGAY